jgi:hypothetical protein
MDIPDEPPALAYIEKTLADSYRKEIDQEENVWRSLPFFAATLALQLAALFQIIDKLPGPTTLTGLCSDFFLLAAGASTLVSLLFLASSIYPQKFDYVAREPLLLQYTRDLIEYEAAAANLSALQPLSALNTVKIEIARQYAQAADNNRQINKRRERWRSIAGLAALASVLMTVCLVGTTYAHYLSVRLEKEAKDDAASAANRAPAEPVRDNATREPAPPSDSVTPADASRH